MNPAKLLRRHPWLGLTALLLAGTALWVGYFLATFDLNHYREYLAGELGRRLQLPVQLGEAQLELREAGIAFRFSELRIGTAETSTEVHAEQLWLQLAWHGLLLGKPILSEVALDTPRLRIAPSAPETETSPARRFDLELVRDLHIRRVEIQHGALDLQWTEPSGATRRLALDDLAINLHNFGLARTATFDLAGTLADQPRTARLHVSGRVDLPAAGAWQEALWDLTLEGKGLDASRLAGFLPASAGVAAAGEGDLAVFIKGQPGKAVTVRAELSGPRLQIRPGTAYRQNLPLRHLQVAGTWQREGQRQTIRQMTVQLDDLRLAGEVNLVPTADGTELSGQLNNAILPVNTLRRWLPDDLQVDRPILAKLQPGGTITLTRATVRASWPADSPGPGRWAVDSLAGEATNLAWALGKEARGELPLLRFGLDNGQWQFPLGKGVVAGVPVAFTGTASPQADAPLRVAIDVRSDTTAEQLLSFGSGSLPADLEVTGPLALTGQATGSIDRLSVNLRADLTRLEFRYGEQLHLPPSPDAFLTVHAQGTADTLVIDESRLELGPLRGGLTGSLAWGEQQSSNLSARLEIADLAAARPFAPLLEKLQLLGGAALVVEAAGPLMDLQPRFSVELQDVSMPAHGIVADLSRLNGRLLIEGKGVHGDKLTALVGDSPVTGKAEIADLDKPQLELWVSAPAIRADELIFRSDRTMLRNLSGRLLLDRDGLRFAPVKVRLDGGTRATVTGTVSNFDAPEVDLEISGEYANIEEIIGLWTNVSPAAGAARKARTTATSAHKPLLPIRIRVEAKEGDLYSMKFTNAKALIVPTAASLLIHPLDFKVGDGYCTTQVLVDFTGEASVIRVSGHVENVDSYQVYNELLDRKSIMRGTLRGDFYLQGELGKGRFLPSSYGNVRATVRDGVMRHSPLLSTLFSLLNVSQLFQFKLPDINLEGLPFSLLTTELAIDQGVVRTEHLVIDSNAMNMSYVGQYDMVGNQLDLLVVAKPLGTIDKVVTRLPIAGWILGGEERALITAQFKVTGPADKPKVEAIPISAISKGVLGVFQRTLSLPLKLIEDPAILWGGGGKKPD